MSDKFLFVINKYGWKGVNHLQSITFENVSQLYFSRFGRGHMPPRKKTYQRIPDYLCILLYRNGSVTAQEFSSELLLDAYETVFKEILQGFITSWNLLETVVLLFGTKVKSLHKNAAYK